MTIKKIALLSATAALSGALVACGGSDSSSDSASDTAAGSTTETTTESGTNYILAASSEPQNPLVPGNTNETGGGILLDNIFSGLVYFDENGDPQNEVAESIEPNGDNTVFTIKLKDWKFSDGSEVTAHSFVDAWNYTVANDHITAQAFEPILGYAEGVEELEGLEVIDDKTFTITLAAPEAEYPLRLGYSAYFPLPEVAFDDIEAYGQKPVSNGPYKLESWTHNQEAIIVPNEEYIGDRVPANDGVKFTFYPNPQASYADLLAGNLDVLDHLPDSAFAVYEDDLGDRAINQPAAVNQFFAIPVDLDHFGGEEGKLRRQALSHAIDRDQITETIFHGTRTPATDFSSPVVAGYDDSLEGSDVLTFDADLAQELWAKADEISEWSGTFQIAYNADGGHQSWVDAVSNQIRNTLGIDAEGLPYPDFKSFRDDVVGGTVGAAFRTGLQAGFPSVGSYLSDTYSTGSPSNDTGYSNPVFDEAIAKAKAAATPEESAQLYNEAQSILFEDLPFIPLWYANVTGGYSEHVDNVVVNWKSQPVFHKITKHDH